MPEYFETHATGEKELVFDTYIGTDEYVKVLQEQNRIFMFALESYQDGQARIKLIPHRGMVLVQPVDAKVDVGRAIQGTVTVNRQVNEGAASLGGGPHGLVTEDPQPVDDDEDPVEDYTGNGEEHE